MAPTAAAAAPTEAPMFRVLLVLSAEEPASNGLICRTAAGHDGTAAQGRRVVAAPAGGQSMPAALGRRGLVKQAIRPTGLTMLGNMLD
jgi:hypothetical protein